MDGSALVLNVMSRLITCSPKTYLSLYCFLLYEFVSPLCKAGDPLYKLVLYAQCAGMKSLIKLYKELNK